MGVWRWYGIRQCINIFLSLIDVFYVLFGESPSKWFRRRRFHHPQRWWRWHNAGRRRRRKARSPVLDETSLPHSLYIYIALREGEEAKRKLMKITTISCCAKREQLHNLLSSLGALSSLINTLLLWQKSFFARTVLKEIETATDGLFILKRKGPRIVKQEIARSRKKKVSEPCFFCGGITKWPKVRNTPRSLLEGAKSPKQISLSGDRF